MIPHFSNECLSQVGKVDGQVWPKYQENLLEKENIDIVIQINGRKRALMNVKKGIDEKNLIDIIKKDKIGEKYLLKKNIKKVIFVQNRLINILVNE